MTYYQRVAFHMGLVSFVTTTLLFASIGTPGGNGQIPYITIDSTEVDRDATIEVVGIDPDNPFNHFYFLYSTEQYPNGGIEFPYFGPGAVLVPNVSISSSGVFHVEMNENPFEVNIPSICAGITIYCQALIPDPASKGGCSFSEVLTIDFEDEYINPSQLKMETLGFYHTLGVIKDFAFVNNAIYLLSENYGLLWLDCSDPNKPLIGSYQDDFAGDQFLANMSIQGDKGLVTNENTLLTFHISSNHQITYHGEYNSYKKILMDCVYLNDHAYVCNEKNYIQIIDTSDFSNPSFIGSFETPQYIVQMQGLSNILIVECLSSICIYDISNPEAPLLIQTIEGDLCPRYMCVNGDHLFYIDVKHDQLHCLKWNGSNNFNNIALTNIQNCKGLSTYNDYLYAYQSGIGFKVFDISNAGYGNIQQISSIPCSDSSNKAHLIPNSSYLYSYLNDTNSFLVLDINSSTVIPFEDLDQKNDAYAVNIYKDYAIVSRGQEGIDVFDISDPSKIKLIDKVDTTKSIDSAIYDNFIYSSMGIKGIEVYSISNSGQLSFVYSFDTIGLAYRLACKDNYLLVADTDNGLCIFDLINPQFPNLVNEVHNIGYTKNVIANGNIAYVLSSDGVYLIDISNPNTSNVVGYASMSLASYTMLGLKNDFLYVTSANSIGVAIFDVSKSADPKYISHIQINGNVSGIEFYKNLAFFSNETSKTTNGIEKAVFVYDICDPSNPKVATKYPYVYNSNRALNFVKDKLLILDDTCVISFVQIKVE